MRIELDRFGFDVPSGFEDVTSYTFKDTGEQQVLTVSFGARPPEATNLARLMALRRGNLDIVMPGAAKIEGESNIRVDGLPGRMLAFTFQDRGTQFRERWAVALPTPDLYLQLSYVAPAHDNKAADRFSHICASVVAARKAAPPDSPSGYVRRWAERMTLDVPAVLLPPLTYQFTARENSEIRMLLQYEDPRRPGGSMPSLAQDLAYDATQGAIGDREVHSLTGEYGTGSLTSYSITPQGAPASSASVADLVLNNGLHVRISIHGPAASAARLQASITSMVQTLTSK
jgi:hypothetical protein